ncbi:MAG: HPr family phosphocarrier protein [Firmicutes bacterium]|nr:HPr family phosphocarrier protein [Bacillota bacterium]
MQTIPISIHNFLKARRFCSLVSRFHGRFDLLQDHYVVNAASLLGLFSLDLSRPMTLSFESEEDPSEVKEAFREFTI